MEIGTASAITLYNYQLAQKNGGQISLPAPQATFGGLNASTISTLFSDSRATSEPTGLEGYSAAVNLNSALVLTAYVAQQNEDATSVDPTEPSKVQQAIQSAQTSLFTNTLDLLG